MKKFINDCLTGKNCETYDIGRVLWVLSVLIYLGLSISGVVLERRFDYQSFGIGLGAVLAAGGIGIGVKKMTEP